MHYGSAWFDEHIDRHGTACDKWDGINEGRETELLPMWVADMDFRCPAEVTDALVRRAQHPIYGYTEQTTAAVEAMLAFLKRRHGISITKEQQVTLPCVVTGLRAAVRALTCPGDGVLVQPPVYGPFYGSVNANGRIVVESPLVLDENGVYRMDFEGIEAAFQGGVKLMLLCNPHNPVGRCWTRAELTRLYGLCKAYGVTLISDEIHMDFVFERGAFVSALTLDESEDAAIIMLTSASKTFNLAGLRQAALLTRNPALLKALVSDTDAAGVVSGNIFSFIATEAAYLHGDAWLDAMVAYLTEAQALVRRELAARLPDAVMAPMEATYLAWLDLRAYGHTTAELTRLTHDAGVAFTPGTFFGRETGEGFLRLNFACPHSQTLEALRRLETALKHTDR